MKSYKQIIGFLGVFLLSNQITLVCTCFLKHLQCMYVLFCVWFYLDSGNNCLLLIVLSKISMIRSMLDFSQ